MVTMAAGQDTFVIGATSLKDLQGALDRARLQEIARLFGADTFVETGTFLGNTAAAAAEVFPEVHTIELSQDLSRRAAERFAHNPQVHVHQGDSAEVMPALVRSLAGRAVFWLDGHYSEGFTAKGAENTPILQELRAIQQESATDHVLLIDDLSLFEPASAGREASSSLQGNPTFGQLRDALPAHYALAAIGDVALAFAPTSGVSVSPFIAACTASRLFDGSPEGTGPTLDAVLDAEEAVSQATDAERQALAQWLAQSAGKEAHGLGGHYRLWHGLTLTSADSLNEACVAFAEALNLGLTHWRVWWYLAHAAHRAGLTEVAREATRALVRVQPSFNLPAEFQAYLSANAPTTPETPSALTDLRQSGVWRDGQPLRLHLGCGEKRFDGYVNIDYPASEHNVMTVRPDYEADITRMEFPAGSVDEIRLHHVFEHFNRVTALAMLVKWHRWLKVGGRLHIETPDLMGSAQTLTSPAAWTTKMGVVRHLAGDQAADWAYHVDHWFPERFRRTLETLGFGGVQAVSQSWPTPPFLSNVTAVAVKTQERTQDELLAAADSLLWESTIAPVEAPTYEVWRGQLRRALESGAAPRKTQTPQPTIQPQAPAPTAQTAPSALPPLPFPRRPQSDFGEANQRERDRWIKAKAATIPAGSRVLDVGAGTCPYRALFAHCDYQTHDFKQYEGVKLGGTHDYGHIDYVSDVASIPAPDASFDVILCTEVLEHVPEPIAALREMARLLRPGGRMLVTAPLGSGLHQMPFHFYGGYTPEWYKYFGAKFGLNVQEVTPNGGFFRLLAQECARVSWTLPEHAHLHGDNLRFVQQLFGDWLPQYLFGLEDQHLMPQFTIGYHVEAFRCRDAATVQADIDQDPRNVALYAEAALACLAEGDGAGALRFYEDACELDAEHAGLTQLHAYFYATGGAK